jgi:D-serine deaminase-like pyridoxal phosphate-dependent protein
VRRDLRNANPSTKAEITTPALLVDLAAMEQNLKTMSAFFQGKPAKLRPHFKNHRVLELAARQIAYGAIGITCARLWQAEKLVSSGIGNVLIANEIAGEAEIRRFSELSEQAPVVVAVDNPAVVEEMGRAARNRKVELHVVVDVDLGLKRCGVVPGEPALMLARKALEQGLKVRGIMGYEGHLQPLVTGPEKQAAVTQAIGSLVKSAKCLSDAGIATEIVSCGGSGDYSIAGSFPGVTEIQAGSYMLMDTWYAPYAPNFTQTLSVLATVISKTPGERMVLDAGVKAISGERGLPTLKVEGLKLRALHAEHAPVDIVGPDVKAEVGDRMEIPVHYHDGTIHLHERMYGMRGDKVERIFQIEH